MAKIVNRYRDRIVNFRVTEDEYYTIESSIKISGLHRGEYLRKLLLEQKIEVQGSKFESDRIAYELKKMNQQLLELDDSLEHVKACKILLNELLMIVEKNKNAQNKLNDNGAPEKCTNQKNSI